MGLFKKQIRTESARESDFQIVLDIVKEFDKTEFKRFMEGIDLAWQGFDKVLRTKTRDEKEVKDITKIEKELEAANE